MPPGSARVMLLATNYALAFWALYFGVVTFAGGRERWASPAYRTALLAPGAPESWAVVVGGAGLLLLAGTIFRLRRTLILGNGIGFFWCLAYGGSFLREFFANPGVGLGGTGTYFLLMFLFGLRTVLYIRWQQ